MSKEPNLPTRRLRRLRYSPALREMLAGVRLSREELIAPLFVRAGQGVANEIPSMPGQFQFSPDRALETAKRWADKGLRAVLLFGIPEQKNEIGSQAWAADAPVQTLTRMLKDTLGDLLVITDTCLCEYTSHGHCGPIAKMGTGTISADENASQSLFFPDVDNDAALPLLAKTAVSQAKAGADLVAPSARMDGQVGAIRPALDAAGLQRVGILSYAVKYASAMYGPFRDAAESPPQFGDRSSYQMDFRAPGQAVAQARQDIAEGADIVMVKPAATYLDVIAEVRRHVDVPLAAYHVSGEYAQIKAAAAAGWLDEKAAALEVTTAIKRAGADLIITYFAENLADWLNRP